MPKWVFLIGLLEPTAQTAARVEGQTIRCPSTARHTIMFHFAKARKLED